MSAQKGPASQGGQILLVVILVIIVASTIGLSVASRSITSLRTSTEEAESQKALSAAEAGIERTIQSNVVPTGVAIFNDNLSNKSNYSVDVRPAQNPQNPSKFLVNGGSPILDATGRIILRVIPNTVPKDEGADVWFVGRNADGITPNYSSVSSPRFLTLYWGSPSELCGTSTAPAAIQVIIVSRNSATDIKTYRYAYDSCDRGNNFKLVDPGSYNVSSIPGVTFVNKTPNNDLAQNIHNIVLMRVIPLYKDSIVAVDTCNPAGENCTDLPSQGYIISSTGTSGAANSKITVFKGYPQAYLPYLSYGLFVAN